MTDTAIPRRRLLNGWRLAGWGSLAALLTLPAVAMRMGAQGVVWTASDFVFAAVLLGFLGGVVELSVRLARGRAERAGYLIAGVTAFLTVWINGAVGIIGDDDNVNQYFFYMVLIGIVLSVLTWFRPAAMRWITGAIALGQPVMGLVATQTMPGHGVEWGLLAVFALLWGGAAWYFNAGLRRARAAAA